MGYVLLSMHAYGMGRHFSKIKTASSKDLTVASTREDITERSTNTISASASQNFKNRKCQDYVVFCKSI